jgi:hypothetical protein
MPLSLLYKIKHRRPAPQGGGNFTVFDELHWVDNPTLEPFNRLLEECNKVADLMLFPYHLCPGGVIPAPLPGKRYAELFILYPVIAGIAQTPVECWAARDNDIEKSAAWMFSIAMCEREDPLLSEPVKYPFFHY